MNKNKHLLLWSSLGVLALLIAAAWQEHYRKEWRQIQAATRTEAGPLDVRLRQVVVPKLQVADRCVSCHVGMAAGEQGVTGSPVVAAHKPVGHDPAEFGCTVCHGGQGRATDKADAHGDVPFWPEPMIPLRFASAGCGSCHTHLRVPSQTQLARGQALLERYDCLACHRIDGRGGTLRPGGAGGMEGPDLSRSGLARYDRAWYEKHLQKHDAAATGPWKSSFGPIDVADREAVATYLASRVGAPQLVAAKATFHSLGCRGCHKVGGVGGDDGPDLTRVGERDPGRLDFRHVPGEPTLANWLAEHFRAPAKVVPGSQMPILGLSALQIDELALYMLSLRRSNFPEAYWPQDRVRAERLGEREFATDGATLYGTFCAACHGPAGEGRRYPGMPPFPAVANADFLAAASNDFLTAAIGHGRPGRRMPAWGEKEGGLRPEELAAVIAHLRRTADVAEPPAKPAARRWVRADAAAGARLFAANCAGCHGPHGEGPQAPALNNKNLLASATDTYLVETIGRGRHGTDMQGFRAPSIVHPALVPAEIEAIVAFIRTWEVP
jgi:mono/diheme cytochrome c family protein